ncbi:MAG TPA: hypothetical protein VM096_16920 [Vicinamibacterales bacterium]|nr:hypothetical protein [Vicinamibacterales bacterium]
MDRGSHNLRLLAVFLAGLIGAPLIWLIVEETGYVLAYQACDDRSNSWVTVPTVAALVLALGLAAAALGGHRRSEREGMPMPFVGWLALGMTALMVIVLIATAIPPMILHPCD